MGKHNPRGFLQGDWINGGQNGISRRPRGGEQYAAQSVSGVKGRELEHRIIRKDGAAIILASMGKGPRVFLAVL